MTNETRTLRASYEATIMNAHDSHHLTADELDGLLEGTTIERAVVHVAECTVCRTLVELDRQVVHALNRLPALGPTPGFETRVMALVTPRVAPVPTTVRARDARRRVAIGAVVLTGGVAAGFAWAWSNPTDALAWANPAVQQVGQALWTSVQAVAANAVEQPWFDGTRDFLAAPTRAVPALAAAAAVYAAALVGMRRLLAEPVGHARW